MKSFVTKTALILVLMFGILSPVALGQRHGGYGRRCRMQYDRAVRQANRVRGPERRARLEQARREYNECRRHR